MKRLWLAMLIEDSHVSHLPNWYETRERARCAAEDYRYEHSVPASIRVVRFDAAPGSGSAPGGGT